MEKQEFLSEEKLQHTNKKLKKSCFGDFFDWISD